MYILYTGDSYVKAYLLFAKIVVLQSSVFGLNLYTDLDATGSRPQAVS